LSPPQVGSILPETDERQRLAHERVTIGNATRE
jgi:hypothetical protein